MWLYSSHWYWQYHHRFSCALFLLRILVKSNNMNLNFWIILIKTQLIFLSFVQNSKKAIRHRLNSKKGNRFSIKITFLSKIKIKINLKMDSNLELISWLISQRKKFKIWWKVNLLLKINLKNLKKLNKIFLN